MARFGAKTAVFPLKGMLLTIGSLLLAAVVLVNGVGSMSRTSQNEQLAAAEKAVRRAAVQCYAFEGIYPPGIDYLKNHYGLLVDSEKYNVDYQCFASNIMPDITVIPAMPESAEKKA